MVEEGDAIVSNQESLLRGKINEEGEKVLNITYSPFLKDVFQKSFETQ